MEADDIIGAIEFGHVARELMLLGVERARRASAAGRAGGWRWLAAGAALAVLAGFIETAALGLVFTAVVAVQRGFTVTTQQVWSYVRKLAAGFAAGFAIAIFTFSWQPQRA